MSRSMARVGTWLALFACLLPIGVQAQTATYTKTERITYENNLSVWVLGQVKSVTCTLSAPASAACNGDIVSETTYDPGTAIPLQTRTFGKIRQTLAYDTVSAVSTGQRGTLTSVKDGNNNVTSLSSWKRGIPQTITYPVIAGQPAATESAVVNSDGTIASTTDENGFVTGYGYDAMGRLSLIDYPDGDSVAWTSTTRSFTSSTVARHGLPIGHWVQVVGTGNGLKAIDYDGFWRPVVENTYVNGDPSTQSIVVKRYDAAGRLAFQSYPVSALGAAGYADTTLKGTRYTYDALDRPLTVAQDSELGVLNTTFEYLVGFQTRVTDPRAQQTATQYQAYDQPAPDMPVGITRYAGADTNAVEIARDSSGKPTSIKRRNADNTFSVTRSYAYDAYQDLCRVVEPETGATLMGYDAAGNLAWSASGLPASTACDLEGDTAAILARKAVRGYDARNRLATLTFPDANGNQNWSYTPDSLPASVTTYNDGGVAPVINTYTYNKRRLPTAETSGQPGWYTWGLGYGYDANGSLASQSYPDGFVVTYAPNALGQPTQAGTFATGVSYWPNGAIKQFTYGNGIVHTLTQNARQLPDRSRDADGATSIHDDSYDYDQNGNVLAISDAVTGNRGNRDMVYDGLDRLKDVTSPMYGATGAHYSYDVLDNLTHVVAPGRDHWYCYDASWRLTNLKTGSCGGATVVGLGYDVQGNLANKSGTTYAFDYGNRLRGVTNVESYRYDALGRRVLAWSPALGNILSQYGQGGQLLFQQNQRNGSRNLTYVYLGGSLVATRERDNATGVYTTTYQHTDALGSPVATTNSAKVVLQRSEFEPYGKLLNRPLEDGPGFTGHVSDAATGLSYMQQRYYDPVIGRFDSVDPVTAYSSGDMRFFSRYAYAFNNPYRFTDPDGRVNWEKLANAFKAEVGFTLGLKAKASLGPVKVDVGLGEMSYGGGATPVDAYGFAEVSGPSMSAEAGNLEVGYKGSSERSEMGRNGVAYQEKKSDGKWVAGFKKVDAEVGENGGSAEIGGSVSAVFVRVTASVDLGQIVEAIVDEPPPPPKEEQIQ